MSCATSAALAALLTFGPPPTLAQATLPFHVRVGDDPNRDIGQGLSFTRLNTCYLLTARHVMGNERVVSLAAGPSGKLLGKGELLFGFGDDDDLAILRVTGELSRNCGPELDRTATIERTVTTRAQGVLTKVLPDGGLMRLTVRVEDVGDRFLRVEPVRRQDEIRQGDSGSLMTVADAPVGVLVSVEGERGKLLRYDRLLRLVEQYFANPIAAGGPFAPSTTAAASSGNQVHNVRLPPVSNNLLSRRVGAEVVAWNVMPLSARFNAENLLQDDAPPWLGNLATLKDKWTEIDFRVGGNTAQAIGRIELDSTGVSPAARRVRDFEILIRGSEQSNWTWLQSGTGFGTETTTVIEFAPVRTRYVRLRIHSNWGDAGAVGLRAVRVFAP